MRRCLLAILFAAGLFCFPAGAPGTGNDAKVLISVIPASRYAAPIVFAADGGPFFTINTSAVQPYADMPVTIAVVPHYAPVQDMLSRVLHTAKQGRENIDTVVLLAPNHTGEGAAVQLWHGGFVSGKDMLPGSERLRDAFSACLPVAGDITDRHMARDHSVMSVVPYLNAVLPGVNVTSILLSRGASAEQLHAIASLLDVCMGEESLLILGSVDFSHDQTPADAQSYDRQTRDAVFSGQRETLMSFGPEHLDAPQVMAVLLLLAERRQLTLREAEVRLLDYVENGRQKAGSFMAWIG